MQPSFNCLHSLFNVVTPPILLVLLHFTGMVFSSLCMAVLAFQKHQNKQSLLLQVIFRKVHQRNSHIMDISTNNKKKEIFYIFKSDSQFLLSLLPAVHSAHEI